MYKANMIALSLIIFLHIKVAWGCYSYKCQGAASSPSYTCSSVSTNSSTTLDIFTCPVNTNLIPYYCDANGGTTAQCVEGMVIPGSPASVADVCLSGQIQDGYCRGSLLGESCSDNYDCDLGLSCIGNDCTDPWQTTTPISCSTFENCPATYGCWNGKCTRYGSLPVGTQLGISQLSGFWDAWLCESFWADPGTLECVEEGYSVKANLIDQPRGDFCNITYGGKNVGEDWFTSPNTFLNGLAEGSCCYASDGLARCPISTSDQAGYIREILSFIDDNQDLAASSKEKSSVTAYPWAFTTLGLAPIQQSVSGFQGALVAYCNLMWTPCKDSVVCMQGQVWGSPVNLFNLCFERGAFSSNLLIWIIAICSIFLIAGVVVAIILIFY